MAVVKGIVEVTKSYLDEFKMQSVDVVYMGLYEDSSGHLQVESIWDEFFPKALCTVDTNSMTLRMLQTKGTEKYGYRFSVVNDRVSDVERYLEDYQEDFPWCGIEEFSKTLGFTVR